MRLDNLGVDTVQSPLKAAKALRNDAVHRYNLSTKTLSLRIRSANQLLYVLRANKRRSRGVLRPLQYGLTVISTALISSRSNLHRKAEALHQIKMERETLRIRQKQLEGAIKEADIVERASLGAVYENFMSMLLRKGDEYRSLKYRQMLRSSFRAAQRLDDNDDGISRSVAISSGRHGTDQIPLDRTEDTSGENDDGGSDLGETVQVNPRNAWDEGIELDNNGLDDNTELDGIEENLNSGLDEGSGIDDMLEEDNLGTGSDMNTEFDDIEDNNFGSGLDEGTELTTAEDALRTETDEGTELADTENQVGNHLGEGVPMTSNMVTRTRVLSPKTLRRTSVAMRTVAKTWRKLRRFSATRTGGKTWRKLSRSSATKTYGKACKRLRTFATTKTSGKT
ncbi:hypothetical protein B0H63DRAFT_255165 [Podospora didyma]|uniref:Uncharacterized protein n=1 Tax=Podospora didyma TaxID=330526 RepID=A0AAE0KDK7_9PEZI|nr:hypothetical protein B0H63DRAFT_255165 [Podospora didyma]